MTKVNFQMRIVECGMRKSRNSESLMRAIGKNLCGPEAPRRAGPASGFIPNVWLEIEIYAAAQLRADFEVTGWRAARIVPWYFHGERNHVRLASRGRPG